MPLTEQNKLIHEQCICIRRRAYELIIAIDSTSLQRELAARALEAAAEAIGHWMNNNDMSAARWVGWGAGNLFRSLEEALLEETR